MKVFLILTAAALMGTTAQAGESTIGNGGDVLVCTSGVTMFDAYEATKNGYPLDLGNSALTLEEKFNIVLRRLDGILPAPLYNAVMSSVIEQEFKGLLADYRLYLQNPGQPIRGKVVNFTNEDLMDIPDAGRGGYPPECYIKQIAVQKEPERFDDLKYDIDIKLLIQLDKDNVVMLFTHEIIWGLRKSAISSSESIRFAVGQLSSNRLDTPNLLDKGTLAYGLGMDWTHNSLTLKPPTKINKKSYILNPEAYPNQGLSIQGTTYNLDYYSNNKHSAVSFYETGPIARYDAFGKYRFRVANLNYEGSTNCNASNCSQTFSVYFDEQGQIYNIVESISGKDAFSPTPYRDRFLGKLKKLFYNNGTLAVSASDKILHLQIPSSTAVWDTNGAPISPVEDIEMNVTANGVGYYGKPKYRNVPLVMDPYYHFMSRASYLDEMCKQLGSNAQKFLMAYHADTVIAPIPSGTTYAYYDVRDRTFKIKTDNGAINVEEKINNFICLGSDFKLLVPEP